MAVLVPGWRLASFAPVTNSHLSGCECRQNPNKDAFTKCFDTAGKGTPTTPTPRQSKAAATEAVAAAGGAASPIAAEKARLDRMKNFPGDNERPMTPTNTTTGSIGEDGKALEEFKHAVKEVELENRVVFTLKELQAGCPVRCHGTDGTKFSIRDSLAYLNSTSAFVFAYPPTSLPARLRVYSFIAAHFFYTRLNCCSGGRQAA